MRSDGIIKQRAASLKRLSASAVTACLAMPPQRSAFDSEFGLLRGIFQQLGDALRGLRALLQPVFGTSAVDPQPSFTTGGAGIEEANTLKRAAITGRTNVGDDNLIERTPFRATTGQTDFDHVLFQCNG
jgi:hypothetical protein